MTVDKIKMRIKKGICRSTKRRKRQEQLAPREGPNCFHRHKNDVIKTIPINHDNNPSCPTRFVFLFLFLTLWWGRRLLA